MQRIGAYEAKTHLPQLLDEVSQGGTVTITRHGVPVALLVPAPNTPHKSTREVIDALRQFRRGKTLGDITVRDLVEEGRRF